MKRLAQFLFFYIIIVQTTNIFIGPDFHSIMFLKFTLFELGVIASSFFILFKLYKFFSKMEYDENNFIISVIGIYILYQFIVIAPMLYLDNYTIKEVAYAVFRRSYFLVIPFIYWFVIPSFKKLTTPINIINVTGLILLALFIFNYISGYKDFTSTGELRLAPGVATMIYIFILVTNFSLFSGTKTNYFYVLIALVGFVFTNHKSAYLGIFIVTILALLNSKRINNKLNVAFHSLLLMLFILLPLTQIPIIADNFVSRVTTSFTTNDPNADDRIKYYGKAWDYFTQHPFNGSGDNLKFYETTETEGIPPHSFIFQFLATNGIIGTTFLMFIISYFLYIGFRNRRDLISFQMLLVIVFYLVFTVLNENFYSPRNILILNFSSAMLLFRNKCVENAKIVLTPLLNISKSDHIQTQTS